MPRRKGKSKKGRRSSFKIPLLTIASIALPAIAGVAEGSRKTQNPYQAANGAIQWQSYYTGAVFSLNSDGSPSPVAWDFGRLAIGYGLPILVGAVGKSGILRGVNSRLARSKLPITLG